MDFGFPDVDEKVNNYRTDLTFIDYGIFLNQFLMLKKFSITFHNIFNNQKLFFGDIDIKSR